MAPLSRGGTVVAQVPSGGNMKHHDLLIALVPTLVLAGCGPASDVGDDACSEGTCVGSLHEAMRAGGADAPPPPESGSTTTTVTRPTWPSLIYPDLILTGRAAFNTPFLYIEVTNVGTGPVSPENLNRGTIVLDGQPYHAELASTVPASTSAKIAVDLTHYIGTPGLEASGLCRTHSVVIDTLPAVFGSHIWQTSQFVNPPSSVYDNDAGTVHTQCPLEWTATITPERLGVYPDDPIDRASVSRDFTAPESKLSPVIDDRTLGTTLQAIVSSQAIVRDQPCSACHYREAPSDQPYRPDIDKFSTQTISESDQIGGTYWGGEYGWARRFVDRHDPANPEYYLKPPALRWLAKRYRQQNDWVDVLDLP
jgi:hypothetical protein